MGRGQTTMQASESRGRINTASSDLSTLLPLPIVALSLTELRTKLGSLESPSR
jgi:hypothetical protein